jgi:hypothetical protein
LATNVIHRFHDELSKSLQKEIMVPRPNLRFGNGTFIPTDASLEKGVKTVYASTLEAVGDADFVAGDAEDIPLVNVTEGRDDYPTFLIAAGYKVSLADTWAETYSGRLQRHESRKLANLARVIDEKMDRFARYGSTKVGATGLYNNANVTPETWATSPYLTTTTNADIEKWFLDSVEAMDSAADGAYADGVFEDGTTVGSEGDMLGVVCVVPKPLLYELHRRKHPQTERSLYTTLTEDGSPILDIKGTNAGKARNLQAQGGIGNGTLDRMIMYQANQQYLERLYSPSELAPPDWVGVKGMTKTFPMYASTTPVMIHHPATLRYIDFPRKP